MLIPPGLNATAAGLDADTSWTQHRRCWTRHGHFPQAALLTAREHLSIGNHPWVRVKCRGNLLLYILGVVRLPNHTVLHYCIGVKWQEVASRRCSHDRLCSRHGQLILIIWKLMSVW